jgi:hypothetical protein
MAKQPQLPLMYMKMASLITEQSQGLREVRLDDMCSSISVKYRINLKEAKQIINEMNTVFGFGVNFPLNNRRKFKVVKPI